MTTEAIMMSIFIVFMGYFTNPMRIKMFLFAVLGLESGMIVELLINAESKVQDISTAVNTPVWVWLIVAVYFFALYKIGVWLAELDKDIEYYAKFEEQS